MNISTHCHIDIFESAAHSIKRTYKSKIMEKKINNACNNKNTDIKYNL